MYGINLKYRFPMLCAMIGSGLAALLCGLNGVMANGIGVGGLPGILSIQPAFWHVYAGDGDGGYRAAGADHRGLSA